MNTAERSSRGIRLEAVRLGLGAHRDMAYVEGSAPLRRRQDQQWLPTTRDQPSLEHAESIAHAYA
jgi:hypothetical protein